MPCGFRLRFLSHRTTFCVHTDCVQNCVCVWDFYNVSIISVGFIDRALWTCKFCFVQAVWFYTNRFGNWICDLIWDFHLRYVCQMRFDSGFNTLSLSFLISHSFAFALPHVWYINVQMSSVIGHQLIEKSMPCCCCFFHHHCVLTCSNEHQTKKGRFVLPQIRISALGCSGYVNSFSRWLTTGNSVFLMCARFPAMPVQWNNLHAWLAL